MNDIAELLAGKMRRINEIEPQLAVAEQLRMERDQLTQRVLGLTEALGYETGADLIAGIQANEHGLKDMIDAETAAQPIGEPDEEQ